MAEEVRERELKAIQKRVVRMPLKELVLLENNARFMRHETFQRLVGNIQRDGCMTSAPFAWLMHDDETRKPLEPHRYEVLSGNHRTMAAIEAGVVEDDVILTDDYLPHSQRVAIQLSHNAITGEDDPTILKALYESIDDVDMKLYAGLDDEMLELLDKVEVGAIGDANLEFQPITIAFLPEEAKRAQETWSEVEKLITSKEVWFAKLRDYNGFMDALESVNRSYNVRNIAAALLLLMAVFERHKDDLLDGFLDENGDAKHGGWIPLDVLLGTQFIPAGAAAVIKRAMDELATEGDIDPQNRWRTLEYLAAEYLGGSE